MKKILLLTAAFMLALSSCNVKQKPASIPQDLDLAVEEVFAEDVMEDIFSETFDYVFDWSDYGIFKSDEDDDWPECRKRTVERPEGKIWPRIVTLDFGDGCEDPRGNVREGKIIISLTGKFREEGSTRTISFEKYYVNGNKVEGTKTITNAGREDGILVFEVVLDKTKIILPGGLEISRSGTKTRAWIEGEETPAKWDNVWLINGAMEKVNKEGVKINKTIIDLVRARNCRFPLSGIVEITADDDRPAAILDYGDGECDKLATITIGEGEGSETWVIDLKKRGKKWKKQDNDEGVEKDDE